MSALPDNKDFMNFNGGGKVSITEGRGWLVVDKHTGETIMLLFFTALGKNICLIIYQGFNHTEGKQQCRLKDDQTSKM